MNYQKQLDAIIEKNQESGLIPSLILHSCCAPCSTYVLEYLSQYFKITVFYYNPNIGPKNEYDKRVEEQKQLIEKMKTLNKIEFIEGDYEDFKFYDLAKGKETMAEGGERCTACFRLRFLATAIVGKDKEFDYFGSTLSVSPMKNAQILNEVGNEISHEIGIPFLVSDFKKKNGYKRSVELSSEYGLYRQDYCGCVYSKRDVL